MSIINVTSREFRDKQASMLSLADKGEQVIIRRKNKPDYLLTPVYTDDFILSPEAEARVEYKTGEGVRCKTAAEAIAFLESL
jgi:hypothetical protein